MTSPNNEATAVPEAPKAEIVGQTAEAPSAVKIDDLLDFAFLEVLATERRSINLRCGLSCS